MPKLCKVLDAPQSEMVVGYPIKDGHILLGLRKQNPWQGQLSGAGGKAESCLTIRENQQAELYQEFGLECEEEDLLLNGIIKIHFHNGTIKTLYIFRILDWSGTARETEEMRPIDFLLPFAPVRDMIPGDNLWFHFIQDGLYFEATMHRADIDTVESFEITDTRPLIIPSQFL